MFPFPVTMVRCMLWLPFEEDRVYIFNKRDKIYLMGLRMLAILILLDHFQHAYT